MKLRFSISNQLTKLCKLDFPQLSLFDSEHAWHFCEMLNQETKRVNKQRRKSAEFVPFERFLYDNLYRYAKGLCDGATPGAKEGDFPNPHKQEPDLRLV